MKRALLAIVLSVMVSQPALADFDSAMTAYRAQDFKQAFEEFFQAAVQGHETAQFNVGVLYYRGEGTGRDVLKAFSWIELSTQHGDNQNIQAQEVLILSMSPAQVISGHSIAAELAREHGLRYSPPDIGTLDSRIAVVDVR